MSKQYWMVIGQDQWGADQEYRLAGPCATASDACREAFGYCNLANYLAKPLGGTSPKRLSAG